MVVVFVYSKCCVDNWVSYILLIRRRDCRVALRTTRNDDSRVRRRDCRVALRTTRNDGAFLRHCEADEQRETNAAICGFYRIQ
jgi:hypothetical protein